MRITSARTELELKACCRKSAGEGLTRRIQRPQLLDAVAVLNEVAERLDTTRFDQNMAPYHRVFLQMMEEGDLLSLHTTPV